MTDIWLTSDTHFNHENFLTFQDVDGNFIRQFKNVDEMNETMIENWNKVVKPHHKVYHLGDVSFGNVQDFHNTMRRLNGHKRLCLGNHDCQRWGMEEYLFHFEKVLLWRHFGNMEIPFIACHTPLHADSLYKRGGVVFNVHGHIHERTVKKQKSNSFSKINQITGQDDPRYINVCVEKTNYTPVHIDELQEIMKERQKLL